MYVNCAQFFVLIFTFQSLWEDTEEKEEKKEEKNYSPSIKTENVFCDSMSTGGAKCLSGLKGFSLYF